MRDKPIPRRFPSKERTLNSRNGRHKAASGFGRFPLRLPNDVSHERMHSCLNHLFRKKWNVRVETRYDHGQGLVQYLARYVRGGPSLDGQIRLTNAQQVNFTYTPHCDSATAYRSVCAAHTPERFLKLVLQHVPEPGNHTVRSYGLYALRKTIRLNLACTVFR